MTGSYFAADGFFYLLFFMGSPPPSPDITAPPPPGGNPLSRVEEEIAANLVYASIMSFCPSHGATYCLVVVVTICMTFLDFKELCDH